VMGTAYSLGAVALFIEWGAIIFGFNALLWIFLPFYLRNGFYTVPEFLYRRFGTSARVTYGVLILLTYVFVEIGAVLYLGALAFNSMIDVPIRYSILVLAAATGVYTILGGLRAVVWTEMLQLGVLLIGGLALSLATIHAVGGWGTVAASTQTWDLIRPASDPNFPWTMYFGASLSVSTFYCAANQFIVQRALAAKDEWHARMGVIFTDYLKFILPLIIIVPGLMAPRLLPNVERADFVFMELVKNLLPHGLVGLVMAALIAAVMGHTSGAINSCTTIATIDFYLPFKRWLAARAQHHVEEPIPMAVRTGDAPPILDHHSASEPLPPGEAATDAQAVRFGRWFGVVTVIVGIVCAELLTRHSQLPIFIYLMNAYGYFTPGIATMFILGILWKRTTAEGALAAGILTIPLSLGLENVFPVLAVGAATNRTGIVFWACMLVCAAVSLCTRPKSEEQLKGLIWNVQSLRLPPEERHKYRGLRRPVVWWAIITAVVLYFYIRYA
jgi:solute:Na+ symporter, SSS family